MVESKAIWFPKGRLSFFKQDGSPYEQKWFPSLLIGLSRLDIEKMEEAQTTYGGVIYYK